VHSSDVVQTLCDEVASFFVSSLRLFRNLFNEFHLYEAGEHEEREEANDNQCEAPLIDETEDEAAEDGG
jgi:hypothetical protein